MSDTTDTTTTNPNNVGKPDEKQAWAATAAASAEAQKPEDPPPQYFIEKLDVQLSVEEQAAAGRRYATARKATNAYDARTKELVATRKAGRAKFLATELDFENQTLTGVKQVNVRCAKHISFAQNRKFKVRLDTMAEFDEEPLSQAERQGKLPLENKAPPVDDDVDDDANDADDESIHSAADENDELDDEEDFEEEDEEDGEIPATDADSMTNITDPDALAHGKARPLFAVPPAAPIKRGSKKKKD